MEERDIRLLFQADHWKSAAVVPRAESDGWQVVLEPNSAEESMELLTCKRGGTRVFKTSDSALAWCQQIGFGFVKVQLAAQETTQSAYQKITPMSHTILLVEDNQDEVKLAIHALKKNKIAENIVVKRDGKEAIDYLFDEIMDSSQLPSLIILDLSLPRLNGLEVLERIRNNEKTKCLPVVVLTKSDLSSDIRKSYELGINSYVFKPQDFNEFNQVIEQLGNYWSELNILPMQ